MLTLLYKHALIMSFLFSSQTVFESAKNRQAECKHGANKQDPCKPPNINRLAILFVLQNLEAALMDYSRQRYQDHIIVGMKIALEMIQSISPILPSSTTSLPFVVSLPKWLRYILENRRFTVRFPSLHERRGSWD